MIDCDSCPSRNATTEIVLHDGQIFMVCESCIFICITENVSKENPVDTITKLDE